MIPVQVYSGGGLYVLCCVVYSSVHVQVYIAIPKTDIIQHGFISAMGMGLYAPREMACSLIDIEAYPASVNAHNESNMVDCELA